MSCGVIASAGGAAARDGEANSVPSASAPVPFKTERRETECFFIARSFLLSAQRPAAIRRQGEPDLGALRHDIVGRGDDAERRAVGDLDQVIAGRAQEYLARYPRLQGIL